MKIDLSLPDIVEFLEFKLSKIDIDDICPTNAILHIRLGEKKAIEDILNLINIYGEKFVTKLKEIRRKTKDSNNDKASAQEWKDYAYNQIINKFIKEKS